MPTILLQNGRIFDGENYIFGDILIADGKISAIASHIDTNATCCFDMSGKTILPGLVDVHMHIAGLSPAAWGTMAQAACFPFGVTAAADCSTALRMQGSLDILGIDAVVFPEVFTRNDEAQLLQAEQLLEHYGPYAAGVKVCYDLRDDPTLRTTRPLEQICDFAHSRGLQVVVHTTNTPIPMAELLDVLGPGDIATHVYHGTTHNIRADNFSCIHHAKARGVIIDSGFGGSAHVDFSIFTDAVAAGAGPDTISTDLVHQILFTRGGRYGMTMCMSMAKHMGMTEDAVFRAVTTKAGASLGRPWGRLTEGATADLCVLEVGEEPFNLTDRAGNRIQSSTGYRCCLTLKHGTVVYRR